MTTAPRLNTAATVPWDELPLNQKSDVLAKLARGAYNGSADVARLRQWRAQVCAKMRTRPKQVTREDRRLVTNYVCPRGRAKPPPAAKPQPKAATAAKQRPKAAKEGFFEDNETSTQTAYVVQAALLVAMAVLLFVSGVRAVSTHHELLEAAGVAE